MSRCCRSPTECHCQQREHRPSAHLCSHSWRSSHTTIRFARLSTSVAITCGVQETFQQPILIAQSLLQTPRTQEARLQLLLSRINGVRRRRARTCSFLRAPWEASSSARDFIASGSMMSARSVDVSRGGHTAACFARSSSGFGRAAAGRCFTEAARTRAVAVTASAAAAASTISAQHSRAACAPRRCLRILSTAALLAMVVCSCSPSAAGTCCNVTRKFVD